MLTGTAHSPEQKTTPAKARGIGRKIATILAAAVIPAIVLLSFSPSIISANAHEIAFNRRALYAAWALFLMFSIMFAAVALWRPKVLIVLTTWAVAIIMWNALFPHLWLNSPLKLATAVAAEFAMVGALFFILSRLPRVAVIAAGVIFTVMTMVTSAPQHYKLLTTLPGKHDQVASAHRKDLLPPESTIGNIGGNVYHIVMDMFASPYMSYRLKGNNPPQFEGFTFYPRAVSNYGRTNLSMRSVFAGNLHPSSITKWENIFSEGMVERMREHKVPMYLFPFYEWYCSAVTIMCRATIDIYYHDRKNVGMEFLTDIAFQSAMPLSLRSYMQNALKYTERPTDTWDYGFSISNVIGSAFEAGNDVPKWRRTVQAVTMDTLDEFLNIEGSLSDRGRYVYLHMMVPHPPYSFDSDCTYVNPVHHNKKTYQAMLDEQFACAVTAMESIVSRLRELDRFDKSLVVFHADHGFADSKALKRWDPEFPLDSGRAINRDVDDISEAPSEYIEGLAGVLFMIHRPGQKEFQTSSAEVQLIDIAPTILEFFDIPASGFSGTSLLKGESLPGREVVYYEGKTGLLPELDKLARFVRVNGQWEFRRWDSVSTPAAPK